MLAKHGQAKAVVLSKLDPEFIRIHHAGIIWALASALDCLAGKALPG